MIEKNDKILVTGGTGFLGRYVVEELKRKGYWNIYDVGSDNCDLKNQAETNSYIWHINPNLIIHLAATVGGIGANSTQPGRFCYDNLIMGCNVIEAARLHCSDLKKFVLLSTVCSYPIIPKTIPFIEEEIWDGYPEPTNSPYGLAKKMLMLLLQSYHKQYEFPGITLIPTNLYGKLDSLDLTNNHVIPALIKKILYAKNNGDKSIGVWGDGSASREFLYAGDCAEAIVLAMEKYEKPDPINIGTGKEVKISELLEILLNKIDYSGYIVYDKTKPNGQPRRCLNVEKAKKEFGFEAKTSLEEGLEKTIEWIKNNG